MGLDAKNRISTFSISAGISSSPKTFEQLKLLGIDIYDTRLRQISPGLWVADMGYELTCEMNAAQPSYIDTPYDPYPAFRWGTQNQYVTEWHMFDLKTQLGEVRWQNLWDAYKMVPRNVFETMACDIISTVSENPMVRNKTGSNILKVWSFSDLIRSELSVFLVASHLIDIFIRSNIEAMSLQGITDPRAWEMKKYRSYATKDVAQENIDLQSKLFADPISQTWISDDIKAQAYSTRVSKLVRAKSPELNVQRNMTLAGMIKNKEWPQLDLLCSIYENMDPSLKDIVAQL